MHALVAFEHHAPARVPVLSTEHRQARSEIVHALSIIITLLREVCDVEASFIIHRRVDSRCSKPGLVTFKP